MAVTEATRMVRMLAQDTTARQKQTRTVIKVITMITAGIRIKGLTLEHTPRCTLPNIRIE